MNKNTSSSVDASMSRSPLLMDDHASPSVRAAQVDGEAAEMFIAEKRIGERIKYLRLKKSMGLVDLGRHTGLSASFLSQLETGRVVPTLRNLARIAMVFSKDLSYFFESLGYLVPDRQLDPYFAEFLPIKAGRVPKPHQHAGCEFLYLLSGALDVRHGEAMHHIEAGDAIYFDADTTHSYVCSGDVPAAALIVTLQNALTLHAQSGPRLANGTNGRAVRSISTGIVQPLASLKKSAQRMQ